MNYKDSITEAMTEMAKDPDVCFIGYGIRYGKAMGTLKNVSESQLIETPVAENLMVGLGTGLSLRGRKPVVFVERADFLLNAMDAIVNHLVKIELMSRGQFQPAIILRIVIGNTQKPLFTGETHTQSFFEGFRSMANERTKKGISCVRLVASDSSDYIKSTYSLAKHSMERGFSTAIWESKDAY